jgi:hypothetical protein
MKFLRHLLVVLIFSCGFAQLAMGQQVVKVRIDAKELDRALLCLRTKTTITGLVMGRGKRAVRMVRWQPRR